MATSSSVRALRACLPSVRRVEGFVILASALVLGLAAAPVASAQQGLIYYESFRTELPESAAAISDVMTAQGIAPVTSQDYGTDPGDLGAYTCVFDLQVDLPLDPLRTVRLAALVQNHRAGLYLSGEHPVFDPRNQSIARFLQSLGGGPVTPSTVPASGFTPTDIYEATNPAHPLNFACNTVTRLDYDGIANGQWINFGNGTWVSGSPTQGCMVAWDAGQMTTVPTSRIVAGLDINYLATGPTGTLFFTEADRTAPTENHAFLENLVQYLCRPDAKCLCEPRDHGYWHRYCLGTNTIDPGRNGQGNGPGPSQDAASLPSDLVTKVTAVMAPYGVGACAALDDGPFSDPRVAALREYATLQFNLQSGYLAGSCPIELRPVVDTTGLRVADAVTLMQGLLTSSVADDLRDAAWIGEHVNNGEALLK